MSVFREPVNFSFFGISNRDIDLDYSDVDWFALETMIILLFLRLHPSTALQTLLLAIKDTPLLLSDFCQ